MRAPQLGEKTMSTRETRLIEDEELRPLRSMLQRPGADPDDRLLAYTLMGLYPDTLPKASEAGWAGLEAVALKLAHKRSRRYHLWEFIGSLGPARYLAFAAAAALPIVVAWSLWPAS